MATNPPTTPPGSPVAGASTRVGDYLAHFVRKIVVLVRQGYTRRSHPGRHGGADSGDPGAAALHGHRHRLRGDARPRPRHVGRGGVLHTGAGRQSLPDGRPAAAFIVIIADVVDKHGLAGLMTATFLAGFVLVGAAALRLGSYIKYIPGPVILGFTSGIGVIIAVSQLKDFLGLTGEVPATSCTRSRRSGRSRARSTCGPWRSGSSPSPASASCVR